MTLQNYWRRRHWINRACTSVTLWVVVISWTREKYFCAKIIVKPYSRRMQYCNRSQIATRIWRIFLCNVFWGMVQRKQTLAMSANEPARLRRGISFAYFFRYHVFDIAESGVSGIRRRYSHVWKQTSKIDIGGKWKCKSPRARGGVVGGGDKPLRFFLAAILPWQRLRIRLHFKRRKWCESKLLTKWTFPSEDYYIDTIQKSTV